MTEFDNKNPNYSPKPDKADILNASNENSDNSENTIVIDDNQELSSESKKTLSKPNDTDNSKEKDPQIETILKNPVANPIWLSISEAAKLGGVNTKTIRRAIQSEKIKYKIYKNRYLIGLKSLVIFLNSNTKLKNKLNFNGIGQYIRGWRK